MNVAESVVLECGDFASSNFFAAAGEEVRVVDIAGVEDAMGGDVEDVVAVEFGLESGEIELGVQIPIAGKDAGGIFGGLDDRVGFLFDEVQGVGSLELGGSEGEDSGGCGETCYGLGSVGGNDGAEAVGFVDEVFFAVVECGERDVAGGAIGGEDEMFDVGLFGFWVYLIDFGFEGFDENGIELLAEGLEGLEIGVGVSECVVEFMGDFKEVFAFEAGSVDRSEGDGGIVSGSGFEGDEELDFGFGDDRIDQDGAGLGVDDRSCGSIKLFGVEFAQINDLIF